MALGGVSGGERVPPAPQGWYYYVDKIKNDKITLPKVPDLQNNHVWHLFVVRVKNRSHFQGYLEKNGIQTIIHYPIPVHKQLDYKDWKNLKFPKTVLTLSSENLIF